MSRALIVQRAGPQTLVVDRGRFGHRHEGIAWCGPADSLASTIANTLLLNDADDAMLECMLGDIDLTFTHDVAFSITGADCNALLDGRPAGNWAKHVAHAGSSLHLGRPKHGIYTYIAVSGGINVPRVLGSRTTDRAASIGGFNGRALRQGDSIELCAPGIQPEHPFRIAPPERRAVVRMLTGGEFDTFDAPSQARLWEDHWRVGHESSRMGYRLHGTPLLYHGEELPSHAVFPGVVQVPPSGEPIVLLSDAHTTGGYPKAGVVIDVDLRHIAQLRPGESLQFQSVDEPTARAAREATHNYLQAIINIATDRSGR